MLREKGRLVVPKPVKKSTEAERNMRARIRAKTKLGEDKYKRLRDSVWKDDIIIYKKYVWFLVISAGSHTKKNMIEEKRRKPAHVVTDWCLPCFKQLFAKF